MVIILNYLSIFYAFFSDIGCPNRSAIAKAVFCLILILDAGESTRLKRLLLLNGGYGRARLYTLLARKKLLRE